MTPIILLVFFLFSPFISMIASFFMLFKLKLSNKDVTLCLVVISLFWGILAFSQKSIYYEGTDCTRYYWGLEMYEKLSPLNALKSLNIQEILNYVFYPVCVFITSTTGNVQYISFFWTFLVYYLTYSSARRLMKYYGCYNQRKYALVVLLSTFCFIAFVQVSELLKNSAAFAVFFYAFTMYITNGNKLAIGVLIFISIGLHPTVIMLFPLFLYKIMNVKVLLCASFILSLLVSTTNIIGILMNILPGGGYLDLLMDRFGDYGKGQSGTLHYIVLQMAMLSTALFLYFNRKANIKEQSYAVNIILLYFLISNMNFYNLVAYLRFSILAHWQFTLLLILLIQGSVNNSRLRAVKKYLCIFMFLMTIRWTVGRTSAGGYASSYMDNSITNIVFSTSYHYLSVDYEK